MREGHVLEGRRASSYPVKGVCWILEGRKLLTNNQGVDE